MNFLPILASLVLLTSCGISSSKFAQGFEASVQATRISSDDEKGIQIMIFPIDKGPNMYNEAKQ